MIDIETLKFPIGKFVASEVISNQRIQQCIADIATFPSRLSTAVVTMNDEQLDTQYRPEGWTLRQVVHHCADSHLNAFIRLKLALTEENPTVKPYFEERWAELSDAKTMSIEPSLKIIEGLHTRWAAVFQHLELEQFDRSFFHPEQDKNVKIAENLELYAWHCNHHLAHITETKKRNNWK